jgi:hypothetical protein
MPRRNPEDINLGRIQTDLEFLIERGRAVPQGASPSTALCDDRSAGIVILWVELFGHCFSAMQIFWSLMAIASVFAIVFIATR